MTQTRRVRSSLKSPEIHVENLGVYVWLLDSEGDVGIYRTGSNDSMRLGPQHTQAGRSDGGGSISVYIPPKSVYLKIFYVVVLCPWPIYTHPNQIPGYPWTHVENRRRKQNAGSVTPQKALNRLQLNH